MRAAGTAGASAPELKWLTLIDKAVLQGVGNLLRLAKILVVAFAFAGKKCVDRVMQIVTPDGAQTKAACIGRAHDLFDRSHRSLR